MKSLSTLPAYVIGVVITWVVILVVRYHCHGVTPGHPILHVFGGFMLGMLSMYIAMRLHGYSRKNSGD